MVFKSPRIQMQFNFKICLWLKLLLTDVDVYSVHHFKKPLLITRLLDPVEGESLVHLDGRAGDGRIQQEGRPRYYSQDEVRMIRQHFNRKYRRNDTYKTVVVHSFNGGPEHFHFQIAPLMSAYTSKELVIHDKG